MHAIDTAANAAEEAKEKLKLEMHVSDLLVVIKAAKDYLKDLHVLE